ncbi:malonyl-ACP O-methyltransferase BioC [Pantoea stewartii]|uniref:Malonyl-[acyl-carrier protein] O-methyltransferase n=1 Tax=Pantoea stewartii subsp. stewartii DC283 TaxID=660596 RepID=H3RAX9_PANSE|nr:malonyl-ACP O-methyltransferase BioC [Pantoea stewartii]ARF49379.1 malonyl-[acyl-carrier protein] O-methyltransferase BioC [Pantoea stewartii subsp. stewartii DC283]EHU01425.1 putative biotin synthesis methltransferase [Pantoea stewartii subsp. stewartii DC283]KAB0552061.1 malonyl-ACP O-methyltransferase BioC [Pantoea stewartii subsp. stewartii]
MTLHIDKRAVARAFGRAASCYDRHAELQRISGDALLAWVPAQTGPQVLDAGCGTGWYSRLWRDRGKQVMALDLSPQMLHQARQNAVAHHYLAGDIDALPLADQSIDLLWSNLVVQWSDDLPAALRQFTRVLKPDGCMLFSTLSAGSLHEVHEAWSHLDAHVHANRFLSAQAIAAACAAQRLRCHAQTVTLHFPDALSAMRSLKGIGATHLHAGRADYVLTRRRLAQLEAHWPRDEQGFRLSYHLMYGVSES